MSHPHQTKSQGNAHYTRNAYTGKILSIVEHPENSEAQSRGAIRARRTRLQSALLAQVPEGIIQYSKKLVALEDLPRQSTRLVFDDGTEVIADIVVGADGLHSVGSPAFCPFDSSLIHARLSERL